jgi:hypothetical protein
VVTTSHATLRILSTTPAVRRDAIFLDRMLIGVLMLGSLELHALSRQFRLNCRDPRRTLPRSMCE